MAGPSYHGRTHLPGGTDPIPGLDLSLTPAPFYEAVATLAATRDLRGYWRLGDGGLGPYADSKPAGVWANVPMVRVDGAGADMTDIATGALPAADDDGAVQFNAGSASTNGDTLGGPNTWGAGSGNPFEFSMSEITVAGWVKPTADAATFDGGIFSMVENSGSLGGYGLGIAWPARTVLWRGSVRLLGPTVASGEWVFVCGVHDATSDRIYVNGALVATGDADIDAGASNSGPVIGAIWSNTSDFHRLYGAVDEVSVWASALTESEIATLAASGGLADSAAGAVISTSGAYTAAIGDDVVLATGTFTVTLPTAVGNTGSRITVKNTGVGTITVGRTSSETIDGAASDVSLTVSKSAREFTSDGSGWQITAAYL